MEDQKKEHKKHWGLKSQGLTTSNLGTIKTNEQGEPMNKRTSKDYKHGTRNRKHFSISPGANTGNISAFTPFRNYCNSQISTFKKRSLPRKARNYNL